MAQLPVQNRRSIAAPAPPPPQQDQQNETLFDYIWGSITFLQPDFPPQGDKEENNAFLERLVTFIAPDGGMPEENWKQFDPEAQKWYDAAADALQQGHPIPPPEGYYLPDEDNQPQQAQPQQQAATPAKNPVPAGIARYRAEQKALREQEAAANANGAIPNGRAPVQQQTQTRQPPQQMPARGAPPQQQPQQQQVPQRRATQQQAAVYTPPQQPQPQRRQAPMAQQQPQQQTQQWAQRRQAPAQQPQQQAPKRERAPRSQDVIDDLRAQVIYDPTITPSQLITYARSQGYSQVDSSVGAVVSQVRSIMNLLERMGRLADPPQQ